MFPSAEEVAALGEAVEDRFGALGVTAVRSRTILALARALANGGLTLDLTARPEEETKKLLDIRGIGPWSAQYMAMRAMEWPDAFLETDAGIKRALDFRPPKEMLRMAEAWRPWRSYATVNLWNTLSL